jgi:hypothetical protein
VKNTNKGGGAKAKNKQTQVNNLKVTYVSEEGKKKRVTHRNIDEATLKTIISDINVFLNKK